MMKGEGKVFFPPGNRDVRAQQFIEFSLNSPLKKKKKNPGQLVGTTCHLYRCPGDFILERLLGWSCFLTSCQWQWPKEGRLNL